MQSNGETTIKPDPEKMMTHVQHLFGECTHGLVELAWTDPQTKSLSHAQMFDLADLDEMVEKAESLNRIPNCNIYVGAALRKEDMPEDRRNKRANDDDFYALPAYYVDLDKGEATCKAPEIYKDLKPTLAVITGLKPHPRAQLWWKLREPDQDAERCRKQNQAFSQALDGDRQVHNPSRVMRLSGTIAWPVKQGREIELVEVECFTSRVPYYREQIERDFPHTGPETQIPPQSVDIQPLQSVANNGLNLGLSVDQCMNTIRAGKNWHNNMVRLVGHWLTRGWTDGEILAASAGMTLPGYTVEQTYREVLQMVQGGRAKWEIPNPAHALDEQAQSADLRLLDWTGQIYAGDAQPIEWLCEGTIPLGVPVLMAAMGGVGKSFLAIDLALHVASGSHDLSFKKRMFGGELQAYGTAAVLCAEDSKESIHRRFNRIDPHGKRVAAENRLIVVPLPDAGGPRPLIDVGSNTPQKTEFFHNLKAQLLELPDLKLVVIDPLQAFVMADVTSDPAAGQYMWTAFAEICAETGATVIITHHMRKDGMNRITSADEARESIRGSTALVDGARAAYALWRADAELARYYCSVMEMEYAPGVIVQGAVVKSNDEARYDIHTYLREESGLLVDRSDEFDRLDPETQGLPDANIVSEIFDEIEKRYEKDNSFSASTQSNRSLVKYLYRKYEISRQIADILMNNWLDEGLIKEEIVDTHNKTKGLRVIRRPYVQRAEVTDVYS